MQEQTANIQIPRDLDFSSLRLSQDSDGSVNFDWAPIEAICEASDLPISLLRDGPKDNVTGLIVAWYAEHRRQGGPADQVAEGLLAQQ